MNDYKRKTTRLHRLTFAASFAIFVGTLFAFLTIWLLIKGGDPIGPHLSLLAQYFPGYRVTWLGSLIGFFWGAIWGGVFGFIYGSIYNFVVDLRTTGNKK